LEVRRADLLVHDATFLEAGDRKWEIHATTEEAIEVARDAEVRCLVLHHLSVRYERRDLLGALRRQVERSGYPGACWWLDDGDFRQVSEGRGSRPRRR
jgi:ribonuclease BN (tRNA processing enzyme)